MATKSMSRKGDANKVEPVNENVNIESVENIEEKKPKKIEKRIFNENDGIKCRSITQGGLFADGPKTGMVYRFIDYDDICEIEYRDLTALVRSKSPFVFHPYFIIDDEDFIKEFPQLVKFYDEQYSVKDLKSILKKDIYTMKEKINSLPSGAKDSIRNIAAVMIDNGQIDSLSKIKALNEIFGTELSINDAN